MSWINHLRSQLMCPTIGVHFSLMHCDELRQLAEKIGMDMAGVINRIKPKMYFIQNPEDSEFDV
ncbi:hypothetical protein [Vibrio fluvialis]|uniref:hypothetical protein n=1 Tax=Vibrio fluvialis TaxID=676 RepID=UPI0025733B33|nr:hypothetical protein [Vibrio fluvialis]